MYDTELVHSLMVQIDHEEVFAIIQDDLDTLLRTVEKAIKEVE